MALKMNLQDNIEDVILGMFYQNPNHLFSIKGDSACYIAFFFSCVRGYEKSYEVEFTDVNDRDDIRLIYKKNRDRVKRLVDYIIISDFSSS